MSSLARFKLIKYPAATTEIVHDGIQMDGNMKPSNDGKAQIPRRFPMFSASENVERRREKDGNYLMMFEFEKIKLIDGEMGWEEEIDQIKVRLNVDCDLRERNVCLEATMMRQRLF